MATTETNSINYLFIIHGLPLEFPSGIVYRKAKGFTVERQKTIKCPYCGKQLTSIDVSTKIEIYRYPKKSDVSCHEYRKCHACHEIVGIIFVNA